MIYSITTLVGGFVSGLDNTVDPTANTTVNSVQVASILVGTILPIIVAIVTKASWSAQLKGLVLLALSALSGFLTEFINNNDNFVWQQALLTTVLTFVVAAASYFGLWSRPDSNGVSIAGRLQAVGVHD